MVSLCSHSLLLKCDVVTCFNHGAANVVGCSRRRGGRRVAAYVCDWCTGLRGTWIDRRVKAGLSAGQAAKLLGVRLVELAVVELGAEPSPAFADKMARLYRGEALTRSCRACGCTEDDCRGCIARTGRPCSWVEPDLCSACSSAPAAGLEATGERV